MKQLAEDVYQLKGWPKNAINVYLVGDVLIDAATRQAEKRIMRQIAGRTVTAHALTHVHPDHQGSSHAICEQLGIPLWCGQADVPAMEIPGSVIARERPAPGQPPAGALLGRSSPPGRPRAQRGRRGRRLHRAGDAGTHARPPLLLARARPRADRRRRAREHELQHRHHRPARTAGVRDPRPRAQPRLGAQAGRAAPGARVLRPRAAAARPGQAGGVRGRLPAD